MYHYTECGLDYVYLSSGYITDETPWGEATSIVDLEELHKVIGMDIVMSATPMSGQQFRFLRKELDFSQKRIGAILGLTDQAVARWEKGQQDVPRSADLVLRALYAEYANGNVHLSKIIDTLNDRDRTDYEEGTQFGVDEEGHWHPLAA